MLGHDPSVRCRNTTPRDPDTVDADERLLKFVRKRVVKVAQTRSQLRDCEISHSQNTSGPAPAPVSTFHETFQLALSLTVLPRSSSFSSSLTIELNDVAE